MNTAVVLTGKLHYVIFPKEEVCFRLNCDKCGDQSGRRNGDVWFFKKVPYNLKEDIRNGKTAFVYKNKNETMYRIFLEDDQLFIKVNGKTIGCDGKKLPSTWTIERILWIGNMKEDRKDCPLALVPSEVLTQIVAHTRPKWRT